MDKYSEYHDREFIVSKPWPRKLITFGFTSITVLSSCCWYYYEYHYSAHKEIPLLVSEEGPTKIKPERAGGALVPNMDKIVYDSFKPNSGDTTRLVVIMPEPEQPINIAPTKDTIEDIIGKILSEHIEPDEVSLDINAPELTTELEGAPPTLKTLKIIPIEKQDTESKINQPRSKNKSFYKMQLASVRSVTNAEKEWERLKKTHHKLLNSMQHSVQKIDLGSKGVFYRLLVGKFGIFSSAKTLCKKLIASQQNCIVVKD